MTQHESHDQEDADVELRSRLRALRTDPPESDFGAALHMKLVAAGPPPAPGGAERLRALFARRPAVWWPMTGLATGVAAFALLVAVRGPAAPAAMPGGATRTELLATAPTPTAEPGPGAASEPAAHALPASKVAVISLNFSADVAVTDVAFRVTLPEGLSFWAEGEKLADRSFEWRQALAAGENTIPIAVRGEVPGRYAVQAVADVAGQRVEQKLWLEVIAS